MFKRVHTFLLAALLVAVAVPAAWAALAPAPGGVGIPINPHGFPAFYADATGLSLEPCLPPPAGNATRTDLCLPSPVDPGNPESVALGVGDEFFFWSADAQAPPLVAGGNARLVLALEGAFGTATGAPADGQQMTFGRVRIRVDTPVAGTYTVTHPFGTQIFEVTDVAAGINVTEDIGAINPADPKAAFAGALGSNLGPFLTWPDFAADPTLQVRDLAGNVVEQYVGNPGIPHLVTPGPNGNVFSVVGPGGITTQTNLFTVAGKVFDANVARTEHFFPAAPAANLFAVGPVNRLASINAVAPPVGTVTGADVANYPVGFPLWYQDNAGTPAAPAPGLQLTICPAADPMCISAPIDPADPASVALRVGEESFFWTAEADVVGQGVTGLLVLALEGAFGGAGTPADGQQIVFGRLRIRIDTPVAGTYTVTHPYGTETFTNVPAERRAINFTRDIGIIDPVNPDTAFVGALTSDIGPRFLTWPDFTNPLVPGNAVLQKPDPSNPPSGIIQYVGNPLTPHVVTGGSNGNVFRIVGPGGIDVQTNLFTVSGKVFGAGNVAPPPIPVGAVAVADAAETLRGAPVTIPVLANDTINDFAVAPAAVTVTRLPASGPLNGTALVNANNTVTYTPAAGFVGTDTFTYQFAETAAGGVTSNNAIVTITVTPPLDIIVLKKARVDLAKLVIEVEGTDNVPGSILTIRAGATATSPVIGTVLVPADGVWRFRGRITSNLTSISITSSNGGMLLNRLIQVR